jgi:hypothetical protein
VFLEDKSLLEVFRPGTLNRFSEKRNIREGGIMHPDGTDMAFLLKNITITAVVRFKSVSSDPELNREIPVMVYSDIVRARG